MFIRKFSEEYYALAFYFDSVGNIEIFFFLPLPRLPTFPLVVPSSCIAPIYYDLPKLLHLGNL
jgi:hypothetical protein